MKTVFANILTFFVYFSIIASLNSAGAGRTPFPRGEHKLKLRRLKILPGILLVLSCLGCQKNGRPANFILVTLDTQRADHISAYSAANSATPNIDLLAQEGTLFKNAYSLIPMTLPSHASLFFSEPPHKIKTYNNGQVIGAKRSTPSFVNLFRKKGFATAAFVSLGILGSQYGLNQGFELYEDSFPHDRWYLSAGEVNERVFPWLEKNKERPFFLWIHYSDPHEPYAPPSTPEDFRLYLNDQLAYQTSLQKYTLNEVKLNLKPGKNELRIEFNSEFNPQPDHFLGRLDKLEFAPTPDQKELSVDFGRGWFRRHADNVFFFMNKSLISIENRANSKPIQFTFRGRPLLSDQANRIWYRREVEYMDGEIGKLWEKLRALQLFDKTAILLVGDHGEGLGEYLTDNKDPYFGHIHYLYDIFMKVPLIVREPSQSQKGIVREELVSLLDIGPTIAKMMGLTPLSHSQGRDLHSLAKKENALLFEETYKPESIKDRFGLLSPPWHLVFTPQDKKFELFNLGMDPREMTDLVGQGKDIPAELLALKQKLEDYSREALSGKEDIKVDERTKEMLRALGYVR
jgi:membrane-anchored protein YejM (alkaline phosphatase superfamily)